MYTLYIICRVDEFESEIQYHMVYLVTGPQYHVHVQCICISLFMLVSKGHISNVAAVFRQIR